MNISKLKDFRPSILLQVLVLVVGLVTCLMLGALFVIDYQVSKHAKSSFELKHQETKSIVNSYLKSEHQELAQGLMGMVDSPEFSALLTTPGVDHDTILHSINELQLILQCDMILATDADGKLRARTDEPFSEEGQPLGHLEFVTKAIQGKPTNSTWVIDGKTYLVHAYPVRLGEELMGCMVAGIGVEDTAPVAINQMILRDVILTSNDQIVGSNIEDEKLELIRKPIESNADLIRKSSSILPDAWSLLFENQRYLVQSVPVLQGTNSESADLLLITLVSENEILGFYYKLRLILIGLGIGGIVVTLLVTYFLIGKSVIRPIHRLIQEIRSIQDENDLTRRVQQVGTREIISLADCFNAYLDKLQHVIHQIADHSDTMTSSSSTLLGSSDRLLTSANSTSSQVTRLNHAAKDVANHLETAASASDSVSSNLDTLTNALGQMTSAINEVAKNAENNALEAQQAEALATKSEAKIEQFSLSASQINKIISVIQDIAEQTNLLALNATIEAARAGEAGRGFSVVASEVKQLAVQTAEATQDIQDRIQAMEQSTGDVIEANQQIAGKIRTSLATSSTIASAVEEQSITARQIAKQLDSASIGAKKVAENVSESASQSQTIFTGIEVVDGATKQTQEDADLTKSEGKSVESYAFKLKEVVDQFTV